MGLSEGKGLSSFFHRMKDCLRVSIRMKHLASKSVIQKVTLSQRKSLVVPVKRDCGLRCCCKDLQLDHVDMGILGAFSFQIVYRCSRMVVRRKFARSR